MPSLRVFSCLSRLSAVERGVVLCGLAGAFEVEVFSEADIQDAVPFVLDAPVSAYSPVQPRRIGLEAGDVEACFVPGLPVAL